MKRSGHAFPYESVEDMRPFCSGVGLAAFAGGGERAAADDCPLIPGSVLLAAGRKITATATCAI
jgi:hypothetical protein